MLVAFSNWGKTDLIKKSVIFIILSYQITRHICIYEYYLLGRNTVVYNLKSELDKSFAQKVLYTDFYYTVWLLKSGFQLDPYM